MYTIIRYVYAIHTAYTYLSSIYYYILMLTNIYIPYMCTYAIDRQEGGAQSQELSQEVTTRVEQGHQRRLQDRPCSHLHRADPAAGGPLYVPA